MANSVRTDGLLTLYLALVVLFLVTNTWSANCLPVKARKNVESFINGSISIEYIITNDNWHVFSVGAVCQLRNDDTTGFLVVELVSLTGFYLNQLSSYSIVFTEPNRVHRREQGVLIDSVVTCVVTTDSGGARIDGARAARAIGIV